MVVDLLLIVENQRMLLEKFIELPQRFQRTTFTIRKAKHRIQKALRIIKKILPLTCASVHILHILQLMYSFLTQT